MNTHAHTRKNMPQKEGQAPGPLKKHSQASSVGAKFKFKIMVCGFLKVDTIVNWSANLPFFLLLFPSPHPVPVIVWWAHSMFHWPNLPHCPFTDLRHTMAAGNFLARNSLIK